METREIRKSIKAAGKAKARKAGVDVDSLTKKPIGRPKKHQSTKSKTFRLPVSLIDLIEKEKKESESFTDCLIRLVKLGLLI